MKTKLKISGKIVTLILLALVLATLSTQAHNLVLAQGDQNPCPILILCISPESAEVTTGEEITYAVGVGDPDNTNEASVQADDSSGIYGLEFLLRFDPKVVEVVDADLETSGIQVDVGPLFLQQGDFFIARNLVTIVDEGQTGLIDFAISLRNPAPSLSRGGIAAFFTLRGINAGRSELILEEFNLSDRNGRLIVFDGIKNGEIIVTDNGVPPVSGQVLLQGRDNHSGTLVILTEEPCPTQVAVRELLPAIFETETDAEGFFEFSNLPDQTFQCLQAFQHGYLLGQRSLPKGNLGVITLPGGDVVVDNMIDISDLVLIGTRYRTADSEADVNGDDFVNIRDLTLAAGNFGEVGPITNWQ